AAATKIVRDAGLKVRLIDRPLAQPLGHRGAREIWNRQLRWARLRRASFLLYFLPEILSGGLIPLVVAGLLAKALGLPLVLCLTGFGALWYGSEMLLAAAADWHVSALYPLYGLVRDVMLPALFFRALLGNDFVWRGNEMQVERMQPGLMMAKVRPRMHELAAGSRKRLRALRERMS
ncbi:MAG: glycosyltransferase, partial [Xanthobacteraceae bacterium]